MEGSKQPTGAQTATAIVVVAKAPQPGKVKTRLCPPLSPQQAARLYEGFLLDTLSVALAVPHCAVKIVCPTGQDASELAALVPGEVGYIVQSQPGLTAALSETFGACVAAGYSKVLCISSDNPNLPVEYLIQAIERLDEVEVVLGPSEDGGYYLVGAKKVYPSLFEGMEWSNELVLSETLRRVAEARLSQALLPEWYDLDTGLDLVRLARDFLTPDSDGRASRTRQVLETLPPDLLLDYAGPEGLS